ncbi:hypothetical protein Tco_0751492 [Tanacetum coccineum]|uniref:Uncharacterized protein n=1 Tax=Tanacetum coccineum TaxID=301880 RepID=A0ABQ4Z5C1_9ASTR
MVAFLTKTEGNDEFCRHSRHLRNASSIIYSLTVNPTVYVSCIKQFWSTIKTKTTNNETQIYAKVASKSVLSDIPSSSQPQKTQKHRKGRKLSNMVLDLEKAMTAQAKEKRKRSRTQGLKLFKIEEDDFDDGFDVVRDEGITHVEGDAEQVVIAAAEVVNAGVSVSTAEPKTPPTTTTTLLEDDEVTVAATLVQMSETSKAKSIVFEDVEESAKEQREGKALMVEEDVPPPKKTQKQLDDERAGLEEAMRLQAEQEAEHAEQIHLDRLLAQRMQEEQEMTEQQKKRQAEVLESAKYYTEEDWDIIRANVESNAELFKILLGENEPGEDFATRMVNLLN